MILLHSFINPSIIRHASFPPPMFIHSTLNTSSFSQHEVFIPLWIACTVGAILNVFGLIVSSPRFNWNLPEDGRRERNKERERKREMIPRTFVK
jgi:hypothetical protein